MINDTIKLCPYVFTFCTPARVATRVFAPEIKVFVSYVTSAYGRYSGHANNALWSNCCHLKLGQ